MGRSYSGDIAGDFMPSPYQESDDAKNFGGFPTCGYYYYKGCDCQTTEVELDDEKRYCDRCYESFEEHFDNAVEEDEVKQEDKDIHGILVAEGHDINFQFLSNQLEEVQGHIAELEKHVLPFIDDFTMDATNDYHIDVDFGFTEEDNINQTDQNKFELLFARWCLAKQVEQCLIDHGECSFTCE